MRRVNVKVDPAVAGVFAAALACFVLAFAVYWPRLADYFVYDDFYFLRAVRNHPFGVVMYRAFTFPSAQPFDEVTLFWRPLIDLYFYLFQVFGLHPEPYHVVNTLVHGAVGALTGMLFTIAPTYGYAVTWIAGVSELLGAALILAALISYHAYLTTDRPRGFYYGGTLIFTALALLSKETTVILLLLLPALALAVGPNQRRRTTREIVLRLAPLMLLAAGFAVVMLLQEVQRSGNPAHQVGPHMARNLWRYLKWMALPYRYGWVPTAREAGAAAFLAIGVAALLLRQRVLAFFACWTIVALLPFTPFNEWIEFRYAYLATLPYTAFVVSGAVAMLKRLPRPLARPSALLFGVAVAAAFVLAPVQTREQQSFLASDAAGYEAMVTGVRTLCGRMPQESHVYIQGLAPYRDMGGVHSPAALNLYYDRLYVARVFKPPELAAFMESKCVIQYDYDAGEFKRVD